MPQPKDLLFCFFLPFGMVCMKFKDHALHGFTAQEGLVSRQEHTAGQIRDLLPQGRQSEPDGVIPAGKAVEQNRNAGLAAQCLYLFRPGHNDFTRQQGSARCIKCAAEHRPAAKIG